MAKIVGGNREFVLDAAEKFIGTDLGRKNAAYYMEESGGKLFGFIPYLAEEVAVTEFLDHPLANSLIGEEGEFGPNTEYLLGIQDTDVRLYVRRNDKVLSYWDPNNKKGFLIVVIC